jgi:hypothetical protein
MRQAARKGLISVAAAGGVLVISGGTAQADPGAAGATAESPGALSGNSVQVPVSVPVTVCGNTANVVGLLNPVFGNICQNGGADAQRLSGAGATGAAGRSPGLASGNQVQVPIHVPVTACGNSVSAVGVGNPAMGNGCGDAVGAEVLAGPGRAGEDSASPAGSPAGSPASGENVDPAGEAPESEAGEPVEAGQPLNAGQPAEAAEGASAAGSAGGQLAQTGGGAMHVALPLSGGLLVGGMVLYRRGRLARRR